MQVTLHDVKVQEPKVAWIADDLRAKGYARRDGIHEERARMKTALQRITRH